MGGASLQLACEDAGKGVTETRRTEEQTEEQEWVVAPTNKAESPAKLEPTPQIHNAWSVRVGV